MNAFSLHGLDGATMDTVLIVGLKIIFVTTLLIGPVGEIGSPSCPLQPVPRCQDFVSTDEAFRPAECNENGNANLYTVSGVPRTHKHTFLK
jgi:hypothetical protein